MACNQLSLLRVLPTHCYLHNWLPKLLSRFRKNVWVYITWRNISYWTRMSSLSRLQDHALIHHTPLDEWWAHSQETDIHAHGGIRTRIPSKWTATETRRKYLKLKSIPKLNTECEFNFVAHCTWDLRLSQRSLWGLRSITNSDNLPVIRRNLLLLSSGGIGSGRWGSLLETLIHIYQTVWCSTQEICSAEWRGLQRCCIQVKRWMSTYNTLWRQGGAVEIQL